MFDFNKKDNKNVTKGIKKNIRSKNNQKIKESHDRNSENHVTEEATNQYETLIYWIGALKELHSRLNTVFVILLLAMIITILGALKNATIQPENSYIPVDDNYRIQYGLPSQIQFSDEEVKNFAERAILDTFSYNYLNYLEQFQDVYNTYYTQEGANALDQVLERRNIFEYLNNNSLLIVDSNLKSNPLIVRKGTSSNNTPAWVIDIDVELVLVTRDRERKQTYTYRMVVEKVPPEQRRAQLGIASLQQQD